MDFGQAFWGSEHPDTARLHVQQDYVDKMIALKRENMYRVVSYLRGQGIEIEAPESRTEGGRRSFLLEDVPAFFGRVRCVLDQWHASHMIELYDEMVTLVKLKKQVPTAE